jgi:predicted lipid-binding transport protein (Tim44 family)
VHTDEVQVVAAAPGTIVFRSDGHFDQNCGFGNGDWNAVYIVHEDGSVAWYGHMKRASLTSRVVGDAIAQGDPTFDAKHFVAGARQAYEMIVTAYAEGDRRSLRNLLSKDVYEGFDNAIRERETKGETSETRFVSIDRSDLTGAEVRGPTAQVTVRFVSQLVSVTRDRNGNVIDGNPDKVTDVTDVWTFARDVSSRDPNWKLVATEAGQ